MGQWPGECPLIYSERQNCGTHWGVGGTGKGPRKEVMRLEEPGVLVGAVGDRAQAQWPKAPPEAAAQQG